MAINYIEQVYRPTQNLFGRPATFIPLKSQPGELPYVGRGIYSTQPIDVLAEDQSIFSDTRTIFDVLEADFAVVPIQGDELHIPADSGMPELGDFEVIEVKSNGGGETSLSLRRIVRAKP